MTGYFCFHQCNEITLSFFGRATFIRMRDMLELTGDITHLLNLWSIPKEQFRSLIYYIAEGGNTSDEEQFLQYIAATAIDYREDIMTIAEQLEAKGIEKGMQLIANGVERTIVKMSTGLSDDELAILFDDGC